MLNKNDVIEFIEGVEDTEIVYAAPGIRARIIDIECLDGEGDKLSEQVWSCTLSYGEFDEYNRKFETSNYWKYENGINVGTDTARNTGWYKEVDVVYLPHIDFWDNYMKKVG